MVELTREEIAFLIGNLSEQLFFAYDSRIALGIIDKLEAA